MKSLKNQKGVLAFDFLVGFMIITSFFMLLVILSFTLSVVESMQYIAFATARTYYAADVSEAEQKNAAREKYDQLIQKEELKSLLRDRWFSMPDRESPDLFPDFNTDGIADGVRIDFTAKVLSFTLPFFLGRTGESNSFISNVNAYIGREPSQEDCMDYQRRRGEMIVTRLDPSYRIYSDRYLQSYIPIGDNGC